MHPPGTHTQSMVTPATGALQLALRQGDAWLYVDPAGPTCALSAQEIDFALRNPNNEPLKGAIAALAAGQTDKAAVLRVLQADGPLLLAADDRTVPGQIGVRSIAMPDGSSALIGCTSAPEIVAFNPSDAVAALTTAQVLEKVRQDRYGGIVVNPAGPSVAFSLAEIGAR